MITFRDNDTEEQLQHRVDASGKGDSIMCCIF